FVQPMRVGAPAVVSQWPEQGRNGRRNGADLIMIEAVDQPDAAIPGSDKIVPEGNESAGEIGADAVGGPIGGNQAVGESDGGRVIVYSTGAGGLVAGHRATLHGECPAVEDGARKGALVPEQRTVQNGQGSLIVKSSAKLREVAGN